VAEDEAAAEKKSRNDMKREARQAVRWGMDLASFSTPQIKLILKFSSFLFFLISIGINADNEVGIEQF